MIIPDGASAAALAKSGLAIHFINEAFREGKPIAAFGEGRLLIEACSLDEIQQGDGVIISEDSTALEDFVGALLEHRFPRRLIKGVPA